MNFVLEKLLGPIARLCVAKGILFPAAAERLKARFVAEAADRIAGKVTDSRLSVMTGLQRRDIARLRSAEDTPTPQMNHAARLVATWAAEGGAPLARTDFDALALQVRRDVHPATQLAQLVDAGTVEIGDEGFVTLLSRSYQPLPGSEEQLDYLARNGGDFLRAATGNVLQDAGPFFERAVHYNGLSKAAVAELEDQFRIAQMIVLEEINAKAKALQSTDPGGMRFRAGGYFYQRKDRDA